MRAVLIALDSVGVDPLGHDRPDSIYAGSRFLFPPGALGEDPLDVTAGPAPGALVATDVTGGRERGAIECAITYTSIFTGFDALGRHGLMQGLGLDAQALEALVAERNLLRAVPDACLANALFPLHLPFLRGSYAEDLLRHVSLAEAEDRLTWRGERLRLRGTDRRGFAQLFTAAEINKNVFVYAAREAGVRLRTWDDVRAGEALTGSLTHELERELDLAAFGVAPLSPRSVEEAASVLTALSRRHRLVFYKYQLADLVSHTGRVDLARQTFATIERFVAALLAETGPEVLVVITSDHGHLEQVGFTEGHPKSKVPTWVFGPEARQAAARLRRPEAIYELLVERCAR